MPGIFSVTVKDTQWVCRRDKRAALHVVFEVQAGEQCMTYADAQRHGHIPEDPILRFFVGADCTDAD